MQLLQKFAIFDNNLPVDRSKLSVAINFLWFYNQIDIQQAVFAQNAVSAFVVSHTPAQRECNGNMNDSSLSTRDGEPSRDENKNCEDREYAGEEGTRMTDAQKIEG